MMGCTSSRKQQMSKSEKAMKAALLIQRWYRRYMARLEIRRRTTWNIFQSIEYAGEQNQIKLYNFFNSMMSQFSADNAEQAKIMKAFSQEQQRSLSAATIMSDDLENEDKVLLRQTDPDVISVESSYKGPHLSFPITRNEVKVLIEAFRSKQVLHVKYLLQLLHETRRMLRQRGNINHATTAIAHQITVCGDLHGKLDDLYMIFHKNGLPSVDNPYVFNGDFVDRGAYSVEVATVLFACFLASPNEVYLNRGNHEDHLMNIRYGFIKEIMRKYKEHATKVIKLFENLFSWLPIATVINEKVLVVHGGISEQVDIDFVQSIDRHKFVSVLRPPCAVHLTKDRLQTKELQELQEWRQILDLLWSDPKNIKGSMPNTFRGGGCYFGPDVTQRVLDSHNYTLLIRSHECKLDGFEYTHNNLVLTVFSASNYYEDGSNRGAYVKLLDTDPKPQIVQYRSGSSSRRKITFTQRISKLESSALTSLRDMLIASQLQLLPEFQKFDKDGNGVITANDWCSAMEAIMDIEVPWRFLRSRLVQSDSQGLVMYHSTFQKLHVDNGNTQNDGVLSVTEMLYRHKDILETIFRIFDKDNSGFISMKEFEEACEILTRHASIPLPQTQIADVARSLDLNKDGQIDFNEFLEAFRIVDRDRSVTSPDFTNTIDHDCVDGVNKSKMGSQVELVVPCSPIQSMTTVPSATDESLS